MAKQIVLRAEDLDGVLTASDQAQIDEMSSLYAECLALYPQFESGTEAARDRARESIIDLYNSMGKRMQEIVAEHPNFHVYAFQQPKENHGEVSRLIAKLRDIRTPQQEFIYYTQRAYEMLFRLGYHGGGTGPAGAAGTGGTASGSTVATSSTITQTDKNYLLVKTPVTSPVQNYAVHKIPNIDNLLENSVICVLLRGALLPSLIFSKEIQEYSSNNILTPFSLFRIRRDDRKMANDMDYILDLDYSYFDIESLHGKDLIFADPMNATGGSLVTIIRYLESRKIVPRSVRFFNVISSLRGSLQVLRAIPNLVLHTLWLDPALNDAAYILPGLGDAGDRLNGRDSHELPRNIIQLIADYGQTISNLYRWQVRKVEETVLGKMI